MDVLGHGQPDGALAGLTPLSSWFGGAPALARFRRRLGAAPILIPARDRTWRTLTPSFEEIVELAHAGLPFQVASERRYDRAGRVARLAPALAAGKTVFFPQIHEVLPRVMRLMVALRMALAGPGREECSFLFLVDGRGREGLGLHHDGDVASFWVQLDGRRTVTLGAPVRRGTPQELPDRAATAPGFTTRALPPGSLLYLPPRTPHRVVCHERSLALSLTWSTRRRRGEVLPAWNVASGRVPSPPAVSRTRVWTQVPVVARGISRGALRLALPDGIAEVPRPVRRHARDLAVMASFPRAALGTALPALLAHGIVAPQDLPRVVVPEHPSALDGWRF